MGLASACIGRQVIRCSRLQNELVEWRNKYLLEKFFYTLPNAHGIDFDNLYDELSHRTCLFNKKYPDPDD